MLRPLLAAFLLCSLSSAQTTLRMAVFGDHQLFWPDLAGKGKPPSKAAAPARPGAVKIAVLPVKVKDWSESIPCDSCHRLSPNGLEFMLENWLKDRLAARFPEPGVELVAPSAPLVEKRIDLMAYLDSLKLPWDKWLAGDGEEVIYRPRDRFASKDARKRLDKLGGQLGASHLVLPARVKVKLTPTARNMHTGGLAWSFDLVLWNVAAGEPEWAMHFGETHMLTDLDAALEPRLDGAFGAAWDSMPAALGSLWAAEPR